MSAIRLPLLYAFAGGCLSTAILFGVWQAGAEAGAAAVKQQQRAHHVELVSDALVAPSEEQRSIPATNDGADHVANAALAPAPPQATADSDSAGPATADSAAVSDVLTRLEAAYRERVASAAPLPPSTEPRARSAPPPDGAAPEGPPPSAPPVEALAPAEAVPPAPVAVAASPIAPPAPLPVAVAPSVTPAPIAPPEPPEYAASPAFAPPDAPPATEIHYGDVNQNTYITNVRQGDLYVIQMQQQQLAMMQYMRLLGMSGAASARNGRGVAAQRTAFPSTITNPDNPWGFNFKPPHLVH